MSFKSRSQQNFLFAKKPEVAREYSEKTPKKSYKSLPERLKNRVKLGNK